METHRPSSGDAIRRAAVELFSTDPSASLSAVAARAGVGRATLHRHFPSREQLVRSLAIDALDATDRACRDLEKAPTSRDALEQMFEGLIPLGAHYAFLARCTVTDPEIDRRYAAQVASLHRLVEWLRTEGWVAPSVPAAWATHLIDHLVWMTWTLVASGDIAARDAPSLAMRTVLAGLGDPQR